MLAIIENNQYLLFMKIFLENFKRGFVRLLTDADRGQDCQGYQIRVGEWCEFDEPYAMIETIK